MGSPRAKVPRFDTLWGTFWVVPGRTRHPLDQCAKTTGGMLGSPDVRCSVKELVASFPYK
jgi:hypothetical protein